MSLTKEQADRIAGAEPTGGGNNIQPGAYLFEVTSVLAKDGFKGTSFITEFDVVESEPTIDGVEPNKPGTSCSMVVNLTKNPQVAQGNVIAFVLGLLGKPKGSVTGEDVLRLCGDDQPARGMLVGDETYQKTIQSGPNAGKPFTGHKWLHQEQTAADVAARRAKQEGKRA